MFDWLKGESEGLDRIIQEFGQMLEDGRHVFDAAANALVGGTDPAAVKRDLFATDKRINRIEQQIRRELVVHAAVNSGADFPACLALMSVVKDAERIGDYGKNIFDLAEACRGFPGDPLAPDLIAMKDRVSRLLVKMRNLHESQNAEQARAFLKEADALLDECDAGVLRLVTDGSSSRHPVVAALTFRYFKRITAHAMNIVSSIVMPVDKIDYFDEDRESRGPPPSAG